MSSNLPLCLHLTYHTSHLSAFMSDAIFSDRHLTIFKTRDDVGGTPRGFTPWMFSILSLSSKFTTMASFYVQSGYRKYTL